jgi:ATP-dependent DNA helicase RecQ
VIRAEAEFLLRIAVDDPAAVFRDGQWEAIDAIVNQRRKLLVVQRTGWGKSSVYFISTRILRNRGAGPTLIISPLLALMRNQIEAADRLGIRAVTINSANQEEWEEVGELILTDQVDAVLISPERLSNEAFVENLLLPVADRIGLLVVDEAHCISDWGHDFRPKYRLLVNILRQMPPNMPVLGTTATANNRVVNDVQKQLGDIDIQRGPLVRESLALQTLRLPDQPARLAWLAEHVPEMPGTGIIYALTIRDAEQVANWLGQNGIDARAYYGKVNHQNFESSNAYRLHLEQALLNNDMKVLVATTALGMGYDKPDLGYVIHYQAPGSVVGYYQQVGRAGRAIEHAYGILLSGREDDDIHRFFRRSAFPSQSSIDLILNALAASDGLSVRQLTNQLNLRESNIEKALLLMSVESPAPVIKTGSQWQRTAVHFQLDHERIEHLTRQREIEWREIQDYIDSESCLMAFLRNALDDPESEDCGRCAVCLGESVIPQTVNHQLAVSAAQFLRHAEMPIKPRKQFKTGAFDIYGFRGNIALGLRASEGRMLSRWGDAGWGDLVRADKTNGHFRDELVEATAQMFENRWLPEPAPEWVTCVPSLRHLELVPNFAQRLANRLGLPFINCIRKVNDNGPQKEQQNSFHQCQNLDGVFEVVDNIPASPVLLVDDVVDSRWTVTVLAALLIQAGSGLVYPIALASTGFDN